MYFKATWVITFCNSCVSIFSPMAICLDWLIASAVAPVGFGCDRINLCHAGPAYTGVQDIIQNIIMATDVSAPGRYQAISVYNSASCPVQHISLKICWSSAKCYRDIKVIQYHKIVPVFHQYLSSISRVMVHCSAVAKLWQVCCGFSLMAMAESIVTIQQMKLHVASCLHFCIPNEIELRIDLVWYSCYKITVVC